MIPALRLITLFINVSLCLESSFVLSTSDFHFPECPKRRKVCHECTVDD
jgi:hypothetical protein